MRPYLKLGDWNAICDVCGFKFKASQMRRRWDGLMTCQSDWETRNPLDFLRVPKDRISPPWSRPEGTDTFVPYPTDDGNAILTEASVPITTESGDTLITET